jgi:hypothetical protein
MAFLENEGPNKVISNPTGKIEEAKKEFEKYIRSLLVS